MTLKTIGSRRTNIYLNFCLGKVQDKAYLRRYPSSKSPFSVPKIPLILASSTHHGKTGLYYGLRIHITRSTSVDQILLTNVLPKYHSKKIHFEIPGPYDNLSTVRYQLFSANVHKNVVGHDLNFI